MADPNQKTRIKLTSVQKLAALLILLGEDAAGIILKAFDKNEREQVCAEMANLPMLNTDDQQVILREFTEMAVASISSLEGSEDYTKRVLEKAVGLFEAEEIISRVSMSKTSVAAMQKIIDMDALGICNLLKEEQAQTISLVLSYLPPAKAGDVILRLPESVRENVIERLAKLEPTPIEVVETVGRTLSKKIGSKITRSLNQTGGYQSAATLLKNMDKESRDDILNNMDERIPDLVRDIKSKMFTFDDLADLDNRVLQKAMTQVDADRLPMALAAATDRVRDALLGAMSKRAAETVREEMENLGKVKLADINAAQETVVSVLREMEDSGELELS
ncbi:MAG: flagellar motor switch protein FliG [Verrucomicrobiota bacterium]|jgi:flagellar motor switch protein FliG|nr:flagellar motor switch protein FliG [Verrucomicrobiota bacterium]